MRTIGAVLLAVLLAWAIHGADMWLRDRFTERRPLEPEYRWRQTFDTTPQEQGRGVPQD